MSSWEIVEVYLVVRLIVELLFFYDLDVDDVFSPYHVRYPIFQYIDTIIYGVFGFVPFFFFQAFFIFSLNDYSVLQMLSVPRYAC